MTLKQMKTRFRTDQENFTQRDSIKGHRTLKHYIDAIKKQEAEEEIREQLKRLKGSNGNSKI